MNFIEKAKQLHNNKYDYSLVEYTGMKNKVNIICPVHGVFPQTPMKHIYRLNGCPDCSNYKRLGLSGFIQKAKEIHNNKYDYSLVEYITVKNKVNIICPVHGVFPQTPDTHINKKGGCPDCVSNKKRNTLTFIQKAKEIHGDKYGYSLVEYETSKQKINIICPIHGSFPQTGECHLRGQGCPECSNNIKFTVDEIIKKSKEVHGDKYNYDLTNSYYGINSNMYVICPIHGKFKKQVSLHINQKQGCSICSFLTKRLSTDEFIQKAKEIHGNKYDYSLVEYVHSMTKVNIGCPIHGSFPQTPNSHLSDGCGCPRCTSQISKGQEEVFNFIQSLTNTAILEDRINYPGLHLDITIPDKDLAIEYNGVYWHAINFEHTSRYKQVDHLKNKMVKAQKLGLNIINIYEDEWKNSRSKMEQIIKNSLNVFEFKLHANDCKFWIEENISSNTNTFFKKYHPLNFNITNIPGIAYYLTYNNQTQMIVYFSGNENNCELTRFATKSNTKIIGGLKTIIDQFLIHNPTITKITSYCNTRFSNSSEYIDAGFKKVGEIDPNIDMILNGTRLPEVELSKLVKFLDLPNNEINEKTNLELISLLDGFAVPDCGQIVFEYENLK